MDGDSAPQKIFDHHQSLDDTQIISYIADFESKWLVIIGISAKDSMEYAAESKFGELAEELVSFFLNERLYECFAAALYHCYELLHPDVILELAWKHKINDFAMPYMVQVMRDNHSRLERLERAEAERKEEARENQLRSGMTVEPQLMLTYSRQISNSKTSFSDKQFAI